MSLQSVQILLAHNEQKLSLSKQGALDLCAEIFETSKVGDSIRIHTDQTGIQVSVEIQN